MLSAPLVLAASVAYLLVLFGIAHWADSRARAGRSVIGNAWVYTLSLGVYCTAWTYFGSIGRAAGSGLWFLPIYLGPTLAMLLAWTVLRKMVRIARQGRITSIAGVNFGLLILLITLSNPVGAIIGFVLSSIAMTAPAAKERIAGACVSAEPKSRLPKAAEMPTRSGMPIQIVKM